MAKPGRARTAFVCGECGAEYSKWQGQCGECGAWNTLSRPFDAEELQLLKNYLAQREENLAAAWQQVLWAVLTSPEFRFNH